MQSLIDDCDDCPAKFKSIKIKNLEQVQDEQEKYTVENHIKQLEDLDKNYYEAGQQFIDLGNYDLQDDFIINKRVYEERVNTNIFNLFQQIKKTVSFIGIYGMTDRIENLDLQMKKYKKTMSTAFKMLFKNQHVVLCQQEKRKKKLTIGKVQLLNKKGELKQWNKSSDDKFINR